MKDHKETDIENFFSDDSDDNNSNTSQQIMKEVPIILESIEGVVYSLAKVCDTVSKSSNNVSNTLDSTSDYKELLNNIEISSDNMKNKLISTKKHFKKGKKVCKMLMVLAESINHDD